MAATAGGRQLGDTRRHRARGRRRRPRLPDRRLRHQRPDPRGPHRGERGQRHGGVQHVEVGDLVPGVELRRAAAAAVDGLHAPSAGHRSGRSPCWASCSGSPTGCCAWRRWSTSPRPRSLLWRIGRTLWGEIPGAITAAAFVTLPMTLGYANYHDLEQPVIFGCVLATWAYLRLLQSWRLRHALIGAAGFTFALAPRLAGVYLGRGLPARAVRVRVRRAREAARAVDARALGRFWALMAFAVAVNIACEIVALCEDRAHGRRARLVHQPLDGLGGAAGSRAGGAPLPHQPDVHRAGHRDRQAGAAGDRRARHRPARPPGVAGAAAFRCRGPPVHGVQARRGRAHLLAALLHGRTSRSRRARSRPRWPSWPPWAGTSFGQGARRDGGPAGPRRGPRWSWSGYRPFVLKDGLSVVRLARETGGRFAEAQPRQRLRQAGRAGLVSGQGAGEPRRRLPSRASTRRGPCSGRRARGSTARTSRWAAR